MLKDAEGNPISITKTDTDVVTIYATVFITLDTSNPNIVWKNAPSNSLVNYLVGGSSAPSGSFGLLAIPGAYARLGSTSNVAWTADTVNKQRKTDVKRFGITDANGNAQVLDFENLFALRFPAAGIHAGQPYTGVMLGTGDGTKTDFELPSKNLIDGSLSVSVDGLGTTDYTVAETDDGLYTLATPPSTPSRGYSVALSTNGSVLAIGASDTSPYVKVYDWTGTEWTARPTPPNMADYGYSVALSSDGSVLAVATYTTSPYVKVYDWTGTEWTERAAPPNMPSRGYSVALNSDGSVLAVGADSSSPYVKVYDWTGTEWTERAAPPNMPSRGYSVALNSDGSVLAVGTNSNSPYVKVYDWTGTEWTARPTPPSMPSKCYSVDLSSDGGVLAVATYTTSPYVKVYDWTGTEWTARPTPPNMADYGYSVALSSDGGVLAIGASGNSPYVKVYTSNEATSTTVQFNTAPAIGEIITADYTVKGVHKTDQYVIDVSFAIQFGEGV
jgi:hypothetical protein